MYLHISNWYTICICKSCKNRLTHNQKMYSSGTCPHCGHSNNSTVCDYFKLVIRQYTYYKVFRFFPSKILWQGKGIFEHGWLLDNCKPEEVKHYQDDTN